jgi:hypothetical protein
MNFCLPKVRPSSIYLHMKKQPIIFPHLDHPCGNTFMLRCRCSRSFRKNLSLLLGFTNYKIYNIFNKKEKVVPHS